MKYLEDSQRGAQSVVSHAVHVCSHLLGLDCVAGSRRSGLVQAASLASSQPGCG